MQATTTPSKIVSFPDEENMHAVGSIIDRKKLMRLAIRANFWEEKKTTFDAKNAVFFTLSLMSIGELDVSMFCIFDAPEMAKFKWNIDEASYRHYENRRIENGLAIVRAGARENKENQNNGRWFYLFMFVVGGKMEMMSMIFGWFE